MVTISHIVKQQINASTFLQECIIKDIVSYGNLAEQLLPLIKKELGKNVKNAAVVMALRRYGDVLRKKSIKTFNKKIIKDISMTTNIVDICLKRTQENFNLIQKLNGEIDYDSGEFANTITGDNEIVVITNATNKAKIDKLFDKTEIKTKESSLVLISIRFLPEFLTTPGVIYSILRELVWFDLNIYEIISTNTELNLILKKEHALKAFSLINDFVSRR